MKESTYISELNYIIETDNNIKFHKNCYHKEKIKGILHTRFKSGLTYIVNNIFPSTVERIMDFIMLLK